jgi:hypothetical protein
LVKTGKDKNSIETLLDNYSWNSRKINEI